MTDQDKGGDKGPKQPSAQASDKDAPLQRSKQSDDERANAIEAEEQADRDYKARAKELIQAEKQAAKVAELMKQAQAAEAQAARLKAQIASLSIDESAKPARTSSTEPVGVETVDTVGVDSTTEDGPIPSNSQSRNIKHSEDADKTGRVTDYVPVVETHRQRALALRYESAEDVCGRVAEGEALIRITKEAGQPSSTTFLRWCREDESIGQMYTHALQMRAALQGDEIVSLADTALTAQAAHEVAAIKLAVNTRQWVSSRLLPNVYGDKTVVEHVDKRMTEDEIDARLTAAVARLKSKAAG